MATYRATVEDIHDDGSARLLRDEAGNLWFVAVDAADGTLAVEQMTDGVRLEKVGRCGVFAWAADGSEGGTVTTKEDGATYGVSCADEYTAHRGEWELTENLEASRQLGLRRD